MRLGPLIVGATAFFLLTRRGKASASAPGSKENIEPIDSSTIEGELSSGTYTAKDGQTVLLGMGVDSTGIIGGIVARRDGKDVEEPYIPLKAGFEIDFQKEGAYVTFLQEGSYQIMAITEEWGSDVGRWKFIVKGKANG